MGRFIDITGQTFGRLTVVTRAENCGRKVAWFCRCSCGRETVVRRAGLASGNTKSCGCLKTESTARRFTTHGGSDSPGYQTWLAMKARCQRKSHSKYPSYGGRGIQVCRRWRDSFERFIEDMGPRPDGKTLDRADNDGDYEPTNCRWATPREQGRNMRVNRIIEAGGEALTVAAWVERLGGSGMSVHNRLRLGWSEEDAVLTPIGKPRGTR